MAVVIDTWFPSGKKKHGTVGGGQIHVRELTKALSKRYPVEFVLFYPAYPYLIYRLFWHLIAFIRIVQHHRRQPFDLIHSHAFNSGYVSHQAGKYLHVPTIHTVHGSPLLDLKRTDLKAKLEKWLLTQLTYTAQITVSSTFLKHPNVNKDITVIPNGVNVAEFDAVTVDKNEAPTLIWVGRNDPMKGIKVLKQAILKVRKKMPNLKAKLVTGGQLTGKALIKAYKQSHVFVLSSIAEGQPITLLEAWAAKLPVVVTNVGDNALMVKDGVNGYLVESNNAVQLSQAILKVLRARTKDIQMGENGYELVKSEYSWDKVADQTWAVYQRVTSRQ